MLHQLLGNGIFSMIFHMDIRGSHRYRFFNTVVQCLQDFTELNPSIPVATFFQEMNDRKSITAEYLQLSLPNLACYLSCVPFDQVKDWGNVFLHSDQFLRRLWTLSCGSSSKTSSSSNAAETSVTRMSLKGKDHQGASEDVLKLASQVYPYILHSLQHSSRTSETLFFIKDFHEVDQFDKRKIRQIAWCCALTRKIPLLIC